MRLAPGTTAADLVARCGAPDAALDSVAWRLAHREARGLSEPSSAELAFFVRAQGAPYTWPRSWLLAAPRSKDADLRARLDRWLEPQDPQPWRRCGVARTRADDGREIVAVVAASALADVAPMPTQARLGEWLSFEVELHVEAHHAKAVVLGPRGRPKTVPTTFHGGRARARFVVDQPGEWRAQMLATLEGGPRPIAEAIIYAGVPRPETYAAQPAPGEAAGRGATDPSDAMYRMLDRARKLENLPPLRRDPALDAVALTHARAMRRSGRLAHDLGGGAVDMRLARRGIEFAFPGENLARAPSAARAHRTLWSSPSHRGNLLEPRFRSVGIGVVRDQDGGAWVCQVFTDRRRP